MEHNHGAPGGLLRLPQLVVFSGIADALNSGWQACAPNRALSAFKR